MTTVEGACLPPEMHLARHATRKLAPLALTCRRRSKEHKGGQFEKWKWLVQPLQAKVEWAMKAHFSSQTVKLFT
ncbi:hypothetical protein ACOZ9X_10960 [Fictibacillus nanhaiensis]